jgi:type VI secretion system secreted protein VgrG
MLDHDFAFHWEHGGKHWQHLRVVSFRVTDALSSPYRIELLLHARGAGLTVEPEDLVGCLATLRIATQTNPPVRCLHGLVVEAEDLGPTTHGALYQVTLAPPHARAAHRVQSRIFLDKTLKAIVESVLTDDPALRQGEADPTVLSDLHEPFEVPEARFVWRVRDTERLDDVTARHYCVQYGESDFDFLSRLLEEEGISYHFEHTANAVALVLTDHDGGRARLEPFDPLGPAVLHRQLSAVRVGQRLRAGRVKLVDSNWKKPALDMQVEAKADAAARDLFHAAYPGRYPDAPSQGAPLARAQLERLGTEARYASAEGACRLLGAGTLFALDHSEDRYDGEYLVTTAEIAAESQGELANADLQATPTDPYRVRVACVRRGVGSAVQESRFRPAPTTRKPLIIGSQTAIVVDEPSARGAEIHVGGPKGAEIGCVRLKFHWDIDSARHAKEPTSCWVRVSQTFAGAGGGSVWHPRVGTEVIVEFLDGDPDRPIVTGRVYNGAQLPPALGRGAATVSTVKSMSSPGGGTFNELAFDDTAGKEQVRLFAGKDWNSEVGSNRSETVRNDSTSSVLVHREESTGGNRKTKVTGTNEETVTSDETITVTGRQKVIVAAGQDMTITADRNLTVTGPHTASVGPESYTVNGASSLTVTGARAESVGAALDLLVGAAMKTTVGGGFEVTAAKASITAGPVAVTSSTSTIDASGALDLSGGAIKAIATGSATLQGASIAVTAAGDIVLSGGGSSIKIGAGGIELTGGSVKIAGGSVDITGGVVKVN